MEEEYRLVRETPRSGEPSGRSAARSKVVQSPKLRTPKRSLQVKPGSQLSQAIKVRKQDVHQDIERVEAHLQLLQKLKSDADNGLAKYNALLGNLKAEAKDLVSFE